MCHRFLKARDLLNFKDIIAHCGCKKELLMKKMTQIIALFFLVATPLFAASKVSAKFEASLNVEAACEINVREIDFGVWGLLDREIRMKSPMTVTCTIDTPYSVTIDGGQSGEPYKRYMQGGKSGEIVMYNLYLNSDFKQVWGLDVGSNDYTGKGTGAGEELIIFAEVPAQTSVSPGSYYDKITATINY
jgi:spore coat protein U-like protein